MSFHLSAEVLKADIAKPTAKFVLLVLASYANDDGTCFPGQKTLCADTGLSARALVANLKWLQAQGLITQSRRTRANGSRTVNLVTLIKAQIVHLRREEEPKRARKSKVHISTGQSAPPAGPEPVIEEDSEPKGSEPTARSDAVHTVFSQGLTTLRSLNPNITDAAGRKIIGSFVKKAGGDHSSVMAAIEAAAAEKSGDPVSFVAGVLRRRARPEGSGWRAAANAEVMEIFGGQMP